MSRRVCVRQKKRKHTHASIDSNRKSKTFSGMVEKLIVVKSEEDDGPKPRAVDGTVLVTASLNGDGTVLDNSNGDDDSNVDGNSNGDGA